MEKEKLKVLQFCDNFYPQIDGVVKVIDKSSENLNPRCDVKVVVPEYRKDKYDDSRFPYEVLRKKTNSIEIFGYVLPIPKRTKALTKRITQMNVDVFHAHSPFFLGKYAMKIAKKNNIPIVATFHSQFKKDILAISHSRLIASIMTKNIVRFFNRCDEVWTPSNGSAEVLRSYGFKKYIHVMKNGSDFTYPEDVDTLVSSARATYNIMPENKNLLFVGQIRSVKNIPLILKTLKMLVEKDASYHLYLVGEGAQKAKYEKWVERNGLQSNVHFLGKVAGRSILAGVYAACDLFFFPSTYDTDGIVVKEAGIMQTPSLLVKGATAAEPFTDGVNAFLAEENPEKMTEKIIDIFSDREKMHRIGEKSSKIPITFEAMAENSLQRYKAVIDKYKNK